MIPETALKIIQLSANRLVKPVKLIVFTKDTDCKSCQSVTELARAIKAHFGMLALEIYDVVMDRDQTELFDIRRAPALVVQGGEGRAVTFYGLTENMMLEVLMNAIRDISAAKGRLSEDIRRSLQRLKDKVMIRVFASDNCSICKKVSETAVGLAFESDHIQVAVIMIKDFPELAQKYDTTVLPLTIFGDKLKVAGSITEAEILENLFLAQGIKPEPDSRCLACGKASSDIICSMCKTKIQAEALDRKLKQEKQKQPEIP
jgi:hypothetical protein